MTEKIDRRVRKTKRALKNCLFKLMQEKSIKNISVKELTDLCDLNRGTFYIHYRDIYDMVEVLENEFFDKFKLVIERHSPDSSHDNGPLPLLADIFELVYQNKEMSLAFLGPHGDYDFVNKLKTYVKDYSVNYFIQDFNQNKSDYFELYTNFVVAGAIEILENWLRNDNNKTAMEMANIIADIIVSGIAILQ